MIYLTGRVLVSDILVALDMDAVPEGCKLSEDDRVSFDDCEVDEDDARSEIDDPAPEGLRDQLDETGVLKLAEAIRCGDTAEAELLLDKLFADDVTIAEWVQRGRYSMKARKARSSPVERQKAA